MWNIKTNQMADTTTETKKRMYVLSNFDGDKIYFQDPKQALEMAGIEMTDKDLTDEDVDGAEWSITIELMTEEAIAALPEYQG